MALAVTAVFLTFLRLQVPGRKFKSPRITWDLWSLFNLMFSYTWLHESKWGSQASIERVLHPGVGIQCHSSLHVGWPWHFKVLYLYFYCKKELPGDLTKGMIRCPKGEKWTSRTVVKINVIVYLEYIWIDRNLPAFKFSLGLTTAVSEIMSYLTDEIFFPEFTF